MAHTTLLSTTGAETKIFFNLRGTGSNTLATNYFGRYRYYNIPEATKSDINRLIYASNHVDGRDVYTFADLAQYRYNGRVTDSQRDANNQLKIILTTINNNFVCFNEADAVARFGNPTATTASTTTANTTETPVVTAAPDTAWMSVNEILENIEHRSGYHDNHSGSRRSIVSEGLAKIQAVNGVKTSIGIELEMGSMDRDGKRKFAQLLHDKNVVVQFENDGTVNGGEYPTEPMDINKFIDFVEAWQNMIRETGNDMSGAGAHITIGKDNAIASSTDLRIRLSRYSILLYAITTVNERTQLFGRDFANYAQRIMEVGSRQVAHGMAFSCDGRTKAFEFRLSHWRMDVKATVRILSEIANVVFYHKPTPADFARFVNIVGEETARLRNEQGDLV